MQPITSIQECNAAAKSFKIHTQEGAIETEDSSENGKPRPEGCYYFANTRMLWLAIHPANKGNGASSDGKRQPICKRSG